MEGLFCQTEFLHYCHDDLKLPYNELGLLWIQVAQHCLLGVAAAPHSLSYPIPLENLQEGIAGIEPRTS